MSVEAVRHIIATMFSAQNALRVLAPEFKWAGMGNVLGDFGEYICIENYGLTKAPAGSSGYDAVTPDGKSVQIKANHASATVGFRGQADLLLVVRVEVDGTIEEIYFGDFAQVASVSSFSARDNKKTITVAKLRSLSASNENRGKNS